MCLWKLVFYIFYHGIVIHVCVCLFPDSRNILTIGYKNKEDESFLKYDKVQTKISFEFYFHQTSIVIDKAIKR